ncbi:hypothetical protein BGW38_007972 [Lunasporangiospora selenospora]|uniref:Peroxiredoxin-like 2A n=1 Tax=Lunasporangiospora selenospora TaxID=979761 RepID=A0A9P6G0C3_9FUNG|nr:hypothetical protein BGW38_007972 [Lunasporangiospora selenospora]
MLFSTKTITTRYEDIKDVKLVDFLGVESEQLFAAHELWKDQPTIVIAIRRPGCQFCREEAVIFHEIRETLESMGISMVCIVHEKVGADIFQQEFWKGKVYLDQDKGFYKALGGGRLRTGGWGQLIRPYFWVNFVRNKHSGVKGNFIGDGSILGGLFLLKSGSQGIAYEHIEKIWGDIAHPDKVLVACGQVTGVAVNKETITKAQEDHDTLYNKMQKSQYAEGNDSGGAKSGSQTSAPSASAPSSSSPIA